MADSVAVSNFPDSGSPARVAWDMVLHLKTHIPQGTSPEERVENYLNLYAKCYHAAAGYRSAD